MRWWGRLFVGGHGEGGGVVCSWVDPVRGWGRLFVSGLGEVVRSSVCGWTR